MRFKTSNIKEAKHSELVSCVGWSTPDDVYSVGDDHQILRWNLVSAETIKVAELPPEFYPTDMHWVPRSSGGGKRSESYLITSADGRLQLVGKGGRMEKPVEAHRGACLAARWSWDGAGIVTGGEDGAVKIWSRSGMLRSTLATTSSPVYSVAWSPDSQQVLYSSGLTLTIKVCRNSFINSKYFYQL